LIESTTATCCAAAILLSLAVAPGASSAPDTDGITTTPNGTVTGTVHYPEHVEPEHVEPGAKAVLVIRLEDVSKADVAATVVAERRIDATRAGPIPFTLDYDAHLIDLRSRYSVRASILQDDTLSFVTDRSYPVITRGSPSHLEVFLVPTAGAPLAPKADIVGVRWVLRTLDGREVSPSEARRSPFLELSTADGPANTYRVSGHSGCNAFRGSAELMQGAVEFGPLASTRMACVGPVMQLESQFLRALDRATILRHEGARLVLLDSSGELATLAADHEPSEKEATEE
jgi:putative lipoprotein